MVTAADDPRQRLVFVVTLRADRYHLALDEPRFAERFDDGVIHVPPMLPRELEAAAIEPARLAGADVDPALLTTLVADVGGRPGSLPLFQYVLTELYDRGRPILSLADYEAAGGLHGAIGRRAESVFADFFEHERQACRHLFLRMVAIADEGVTRRRLTIAEAHALGLDEGTVETVVDAFVAARLVTTGEDPATHEATVEVAHEALFEAWHRLATWLDDARQDLHRHTVLAAAVGEWASAGRDPSYLWTGRRLADHQAWTDSSGFRLDAGERAFLEASAEVETAREQRDRHRRRANRLGPVLLVALVALITIAGVALYRASVLGSAPAAKALVLDASVEDAATQLLLDGLDEAAKAHDVAVETARVGTDSGPEINRAIEVRPDVVIIGRHAGEVFGPTFWEGLEVEDRLGTGTVVVDLSSEDVRPSNYLTGRRADWVRVEFADAEAGILAGVLAAERTETGIVAFVDDQPGEDALLLAGFVWGAHEHHPDVEVVVVHTPVDGHPNLADRPAGTEGAYASTQRAIAAGADVVFEAHGDGDAGVARGAADANRPVWVIGHDSDLHADLIDTDPAAADRVLASVVRRYDVVVTEVVERLLNGESIDDLLLHVGNGGIDVAWRGTGKLTLSEASRLEATRGHLSDAAHERWDEPVFIGMGGPSPLRDATRLAETDLTTAAAFLPEGPWIDDLGVALVGQTLTVDAAAGIAPSAGAWVVVGRMGAAVSTRAVSPPDIALQPPWQTPHLWDTFEPRSWTIIPTNTADQVTVRLDRPGRWMIGMGIAYEEWILDDTLSPVGHPEYSAYQRFRPVWRTFEVVDPAASTPGS
ncbi:MAG: BMP family ABC transporter substrate-binding protein, partial [Acidimicrobiia bacterium]